MLPYIISQCTHVLNCMKPHKFLYYIAAAITESTGSNTGSYSESMGNAPLALFSVPVVMILSIPILVVMYPIAEENIKSKGSKRPKAFYQFWASHVVILAIIIHTLAKSDGFIILYIVATIGICIALLMLPFNVLYVCTRDRSETTVDQDGDETVSTHSCCTCQCTISVLSIMLFELAICLFLAMTPALIFIFYLYPTQTLIRLPFIINAIFYTNSLLALFFYQCERFYKYRKIRPHKNRNRTEKSNCCSNYCNSRQYTFCSKYISQPIVTLCALTILVSFILVISDLFKLHQNHFTSKSDVETLILLVPTLLLLYGSWYRLDVFFDIEKKKSKEELLSEILEEIKRHRPREEQAVNMSHQNTADSHADDRTQLLPTNPLTNHSSINS